MKGVVKRFNDKKGFGFIKSTECDKDIFVHFSNIKMNGYKKLNVGDKVTFDFDKEKIKATNVVLIK